MLLSKPTVSGSRKALAHDGYSGLVLKYLKGDLFVISEGYETALHASSRVPLTSPIGPIGRFRVSEQVEQQCREPGANQRRGHRPIARALPARP